MTSVWTILPVIITIIITMITQTRGDITCEAFTTRQSTNVTCFFGQNINKTHSINISYRKRPEADEEVLLACNLKPDKDLLCQIEQGFHFDKVITDKLTVTGPSDLERVGEQYWCATLPNLGTHAHICNLTEKEITSTAAPVLTSQTPSTGPHKEKDTRQNYEGTSILSVVHFMIFIIFVTGVIIFGIICYIKRERIMKWCRDRLINPAETSEPSDRATSKDQLDSARLKKTPEPSYRAPKDQPDSALLEKETASEDPTVCAPLIEDTPEL